MLSFSGLRLAVFFCRLLSWASNNQVSFWSLANKITCKKDIEDINRYLTRKNCKFMLIYCGECPACVLYMLSNKLLIELLQTWEFALFSDTISLNYKAMQFQKQIKKYIIPLVSLEWHDHNSIKMTPSVWLDLILVNCSEFFAWEQKSMILRNKRNICSPMKLIVAVTVYFNFYSR